MSIPYMPLYVADYEADTAHLSIEEDGVYMRLLRLCWRTPGCSVPDDDEWIKRRLRVSESEWQRVVVPVIAEFFRREKGRVFSSRLTREHKRINQTHQKRREAGRKGGRPAKCPKTNEKTESRAKANEKPGQSNQNHNQNQTVERGKPLLVDRFQEFWDAYPHRAKRKRSDAEKRYARAVKAGVSEQTLIDAARRHHGDRSVIDGYARDAVTWLNQRGWEDEPEQPQFRVIHGQSADPNDRVNAFIAGARGPS